MTSSIRATHGLLVVMLATVPMSAVRATPPLIVVEDRGGASALPYYEALDLQPRATSQPLPSIVIPEAPTAAVDETAMLPVRSARLTPGTVARRVIEAPGLQPFFLVGDDATSQAWLRQHADTLRQRNAWGLVVNVETAQALAQLRAIAPGLNLSPMSADDLAERLGLRHYLVLVTATGIEQ